MWIAQRGFPESLDINMAGRKFSLLCFYLFGQIIHFQLSTKHPHKNILQFNCICILNEIYPHQTLRKYLLLIYISDNWNKHIVCSCCSFNIILSSIIIISIIKLILSYSSTTGLLLLIYNKKRYVLDKQIVK